MSEPKKKFYFMVGLPRSGSTLLQAILNQNPQLYCTPTSPLLDQIVFNFDTWKTLQTVIANPIPEQLDNVVRGLIHAMWYHRPEPIIIDKHRGWGKNIAAADYLFEEKIKSIVVVRDLPSIMASWLTLMKNNPGNSIDQQLQSKHLKITDESRTMEMWSSMVKDCMESVAQIKKDAPGRLHFVDYDSLVTTPEKVLRAINDFLELQPFTYTFDNITTDTVDDDMSAWGLNGMHSIRPKLAKVSSDPKVILGDKMYNYFKAVEAEY